MDFAITRLGRADAGPDLAIMEPDHGIVKLNLTIMGLDFAIIVNNNLKKSPWTKPWDPKTRNPVDPF